MGKLTKAIGWTQALLSVLYFIGTLLLIVETTDIITISIGAVTVITLAYSSNFLIGDTS